MIVWSLAALLLFGQTGISLHQIYCYCKGEWKSSLFAETPEECSEHGHATANELPPCCQHPGDCSINPGPGDQLPCKEDVVVYLQLDASAVPVQPETWAFSADWDLLAVFPNFDLFIPSYSDTFKPVTDWRPPLLRDGKSIRIQVQSFLC